MNNTYQADYKSQSCEYLLINFDENTIAARLISISEKLNYLEHRLETTQQPVEIDEIASLNKELNNLMRAFYIDKRFKVKEKNKKSIMKQIGLLQEKLTKVLKLQNQYARK